MTNVMGVQYHGQARPMGGGGMGGGGGGMGQGFQILAQATDRMMANMQDKRRKKMVDKFLNKPNLTERDIQAWGQIDPDGVEMYLGVSGALQKIRHAENQEERTQADWEFNSAVGALTYMNRGLRAIQKVPEAQREQAATSMLQNLFQSGDPMKIEAAKNWMALHFDATTGAPDFSDMRIDSGIEYTTGMEHRLQLDENEMNRELKRDIANIEARSRVDVAKQQGANQIGVVEAKADAQIKVNAAERQAEQDLIQQMGGNVGKPYESYEPADQVQLAQWAIDQFKKGTFETIDDALRFSRSLQSGEPEELDYGMDLESPPGGDVASRDDFVSGIMNKFGGDSSGGSGGQVTATPIEQPEGGGSADNFQMTGLRDTGLKAISKALNRKMTDDGMSSEKKKKTLSMITEGLRTGDVERKKKGRWTYYQSRNGRIIYKHKN